MKKRYLLYGYLCMVTALNAQSVNGRFIELLNNGSNYNIKVQLNANSTGVKLGTSTLIFTYNPSALSFPVSSIYNTDYQFHNYTSTINSQYDSASVTSGGSNRIYINIDLLNLNNGAQIAVAPNWSDIVTINFTTLDPGLSSGINWIAADSPPYMIEVFADNDETLLSRATFTGLDSPLPVELVNFSASAIGNSVILNWETATEVDNFGFEVERTVDISNIEWNSIGFVKGGGNSYSPKRYSFNDPNTFEGGTYFYRLKQIDNNGNFEYSDLLEVNIAPSEYELSQNYPNPFNPTTTIRFSLKEPQTVRILVFDQLGREVETITNQRYESGFSEIEFDASNLASGIYFYRLTAGNFSGTKKMILLR